MSLSERKQSTIKRNNSNSSLYTKEKENVSDNINLRASLKDGFNATFSKNGTISAAETPIKPPTQREINKSIIEVRQLDNSSDGDSEFNRSESEISNINDIKTKFSTNQSAWNLSELSTPVNFGQNNLSDNEASKKNSKLKLKKGAIKYVNKNKGSRINLKARIWSSEINEEEHDLENKQKTRNQMETFDGSKRMILMLNTESGKDY